jgi:hypothetical protein
MSTTGPSAKVMTAAPAGLAVAVVGDAGAYDMFDVLACDGEGARVRGPMMLEISEEIPLRVSRNGTSVDVRARVAGHERSDGGAVTKLVFLDGESELQRLLA